jgi:hypothetical protein
MPELEAESLGEAARCRREAAEIRAILSSIHDERFREQLLEIANRYEAVAAAMDNARSSEEQQLQEAAD